VPDWSQGSRPRSRSARRCPPRAPNCSCPSGKSFVSWWRRTRLWERQTARSRSRPPRRRSPTSRSFRLRIASSSQDFADLRTFRSMIISVVPLRQLRATPKYEILIWYELIVCFRFQLPRCFRRFEIAVSCPTDGSRSSDAMQYTEAILLVRIFLVKWIPRSRGKQEINLYPHWPPFGQRNKLHRVALSALNVSN